DLVLARDALHRADELLQDVGERLRTVPLEQLVGTPEVNECGRHRPVLGLPATGEKVLADIDWEAALEGEARDVAYRRRAVRAHAWPSSQQDDRPPGPSRAPRIERGGRPPAERDLSGLGHGLDLDRRAGARSGDQELEVQVADEKEVEEAA